MTTMEQLVQILEQDSSAWDVMSQVPQLKEGLADLLHRLQRLESQNKLLLAQVAKLTPPTTT